MSDELRQVANRRDTLGRALGYKLSTDYNDLMKTNDQYLHTMYKSIMEFYLQRTKDELNMMEQDMNTGNILSAINHKMMADLYLIFAKVEV